MRSTPKFDCLLRDNEGDYVFLYYQGKMRKEHHVPITRELAGVVKAQQNHMRDRFGDQLPTYLFMTRRGQPYKRGSLAFIINTVARKHDIRGADGQQFWFKSHGFRHRVGTSMINNRVPQHIVQRFFGLRPFASLAHGIQNDYAAVVNGLRLPWSTGPVEGTVTKVKLIKRAGFGRASTRLLRRRLIGAA